MQIIYLIIYYIGNCYTSLYIIYVIIIHIIEVVFSGTFWSFQCLNLVKKIEIKS